MNIQYVKHKAIDKARWDACIKHAVNGNVYAYSWYLDAVAEQWDALILGDYEAIMPLPFNRKIVGFKQVYQPFFVQQLGVFYLEKKEKEELELAFIKTLQEHFSYFNIAFNEGNRIANAPNLKIELKPTYILDLNQDYEQLLANYKRSLRSDVRNSKQEIILKKNSLSPQEFVAFYRSILQEKLQFKEVTYQKMERLITVILQHKKGDICSAYFSNGSLAATALLLKSHQRIIYLYGVSSLTGKKAQGMSLILNNEIKASANTSQIFDFEGSSIPSIARFFANFGASPVRYQRVIYNNLPAPLKALKK